MRPHPKGPAVPQLSIIVPIFNEAEHLPAFLSMLTDQQGVDFELLICDGGSTDNSRQVFDDLAPQLPFSCRWLDCPTGRGRQMNFGAAASGGKHLLFLHCDSLFSSSTSLEKGLSAFRMSASNVGKGQVGGHFGLHFVRSSPRPCLDYYFYECKSCLNLPGCIHGDQGLLLSRECFFEVGPFDESLPYLEDDRLVQAIRDRGAWVTLPGEIQTSARRFESEGLLERQILNALILNFLATGWTDFLTELPHVYRLQHTTGRLALLPVFRAIHQFMRRLPARQRWAGLWRSGAFVRDNAWQINLWFWARGHFRAGHPAAPPEEKQVQRWLHNWSLVGDNPVAQFASMLMTLACFYALYGVLILTEKKERPQS